MTPQAFHGVGMEFKRYQDLQQRRVHGQLARDLRTMDLRSNSENTYRLNQCLYSIWGCLRDRRMTSALELSSSSLELFSLLISCYSLFPQLKIRISKSLTQFIAKCT